MTFRLLVRVFIFYIHKIQRKQMHETHFLFIVLGQKVNEGNCLTSSIRTELNFGSFLWEYSCLLTMRNFQMFLILQWDSEATSISSALYPVSLPTVYACAQASSLIRYCYLCFVVDFSCSRGKNMSLYQTECVPWQPCCLLPISRGKERLWHQVKATRCHKTTTGAQWESQSLRESERAQGRNWRENKYRKQQEK